MKFLTAASWLHKGVRQVSSTHTDVFVPPCRERPRGLFEKRQVSFTGLKAGGPLPETVKEGHVDGAWLFDVARTTMLVTTMLTIVLPLWY